MGPSPPSAMTRPGMTTNPRPPTDARPKLRVQLLRVAAAPTPLLTRLDRDPARLGPCYDVPGVLRVTDRARRHRRGPLVVELDGPGDPLASAADVLRALALLQDHHPEVRVGLVIDGPLLAEYTSELTSLGVAYLVVRLDAASERSARKLIDGARFRGETLDADRAAALYLEESHRAFGLAHAAGLPVAVRTTLHPLVNMEEIGSLAALARRAGAERMDLVAPEPAIAAGRFRAVRPTAHEMAAAKQTMVTHFGSTDEDELASVEGLLRAWLRPSRFDLVDPNSLPTDGVERALVDAPNEEGGVHLPRRKTQVVAVASRDGVLIDSSLERTDVLHLFSITPSSIRHLGTRRHPGNLQRHLDGVGNAQTFLQSLMGCRAVVATGFSDRALTLLRAVGIHAIPHAGGRIHDVLDRVARGTMS